VAFRPKRRHSIVPQRPKRKTVWADFDFVDLAPVNPTGAYDLLLPFQTATGITLNLPGITIGRVLIKISIIYTPGAAAANNGVRFGLGVEDKSYTNAALGVVNSPLTSPYDQTWMWLEQLYQAEQEMYSGVVTNPVLYRSIDVRTRRKLANMGESLLASFASTGNSTVTSIALAGRVLLVLP